MMRMPLIFRRWMMLALVAASLPAGAHQPGISTLFVQLGTNTLEADLIVSWQDMDEVVPMDSNQDRALSDDEFAAAKARLQALGETAIQFESDGKPLQLLRSSVQREDTTGIRMITRWGFPTTQVLLIRSELINDLQRGHRHIVSVRGVTNALLAETTLTKDRNIAEVPLTVDTGPRLETIGQFLWLGVEHILTGWDHLTFLFGLLVVVARLRDAVKIITSFTIAHSLTLALATFNLIHLRPAYVEAAIAASIVYVGIENMARHSYGGRWALTFAFGLVHGCGFATALRELGVGANGSSVAKPLVCFNLGVEAGQLAITAAVLPWILKLRPKYQRWWVPVTSTAVALIGAWFLLERMRIIAF
jgi:hydrogenase/urease accessory protein HupE